jgi:hypothetical protein
MSKRNGIGNSNLDGGTAVVLISLPGASLQQAAGQVTEQALMQCTKTVYRRQIRCQFLRAGSSREFRIGGNVNTPIPLSAKPISP